MIHYHSFKITDIKVILLLFFQFRHKLLQGERVGKSQPEIISKEVLEVQFDSPSIAAILFW